MTRGQDSPAQRVLDLPLENTTSSVQSTRRGFLTGTGRKTVFVLPVIWSLSAEQVAAGTGISCSAYGAPCEVNEDCCTLNCHAPTMTCKGPIG